MSSLMTVSIETVILSARTTWCVTTSVSVGRGDWADTDPELNAVNPTNSAVASAMRGHDLSSWDLSVSKGQVGGR